MWFDKTGLSSECIAEPKTYVTKGKKYPRGAEGPTSLRLGLANDETKEEKLQKTLEPKSRKKNSENMGATRPDTVEPPLQRWLL